MADKTTRATRKLITGALLLFLFLLFGRPARGQTTNLLNLCTEGAIQAAVEIGGIYQFGDCGTNTLPTVRLTEPLVVEHDLSLMATQEVLFTGQDLTRLFVVKPGVRLTLRNIYLFSGRHTETNFNDGGIAETAGGAIYNNGGTVTIYDGRFEGNDVVGVTGVAGVSGTGDDGEAGGDAAGGAIYNNGGQIVLSNVVFVGNTAIGGAGGAGGSSRITAGDGGNGGAGGTGAGAAIYSRGGTVSVNASTFTTNNAAGALGGAAGLGSGILGFPGEAGEAGDGVGAAIVGENAEIRVYGCTFYGNSARGANGIAGLTGARNDPASPGTPGGDAAGGAIYSTGPLWVTNSTFFANTVTAGNGAAGGAGGDNGFFGGNGGDGGDGGSASGGAIESMAQSLIVHCTFSDNLTTGGTAGAGGAASGFGEKGRNGNAGFSSGGAVYARAGEAMLANNILANSKVTVDGRIYDRGGNLSTDRNALLTNTASFRLANPLLSAPASNGGPTQTMAISTNSPAVNHGVAEFCTPLDQRGTNRVDTCDIGAYETTVLQNGGGLPQIPTAVLNALSVAGKSNIVTLSWPLGYTNLYLQFTTNLDGTNTVWTLAPQVPGTNSGTNVVTISSVNSARRLAFFRLFGLTNLLYTNLISVSTAPTNSGPPSP